MDTSSVGTRMVENGFLNNAEYPAVHGHLIAYIDGYGNVLGWSYSRELTDKWIGKGEVLEDLS